MTSRRGSLALTILKGLLFVATLGTASQLLAKRLTTGDETTDSFGLAAIIGGRELASQASALRWGTGLAIVGGLEIDLRDATPDPAGASLRLATYVGGIEVQVPAGWAVEVDSRAVMGGVAIDVADPVEAAADAPRLHITASTWFGGIHIKDDRTRD